MSSRTVICTLYEGHYHHGVAALVNSLHKQGFKGDIYVGYRGALPAWANFPVTNQPIDWTGSQSFQLTESLQLHFLLLDTDYHFTNFKPDFMLMLLETVAKNTRQLFYFDPDIVLMAPWTFFQDWATCGVAVCEDVNSPLPQFHPRRVAWRRYFSSKNIKLQFRNDIYVNGGFVGVESKAFLITWQQVQEAMAPQIGGLNRSSLSGTPLLDTHQGAFNKTDQDALNAAIEAWEGDVSFIGKEAMAFRAGNILMAHALGKSKPWKKFFIRLALKGIPPSKADIAYWQSTSGVINIHTTFHVKKKNAAIKIASLIGRFYKRS